MIIGHARHGLLDGVPGAELLGLQYPAEVRGAHGRSHAFAAVAVDDVDERRLERRGRIEHMGKQGVPGERLEDLRQVRVHPLALTRREDHYG